MYFNLHFIFTGDLFGKFLALISLIPFAIVTGFVTLILFRRDLHTVSKNFENNNNCASNSCSNLIFIFRFHFLVAL